jgi:GNAT superfamily N-acetyltransferase
LQRPEDDEGIVALLEAAFERWPSFDTGVAPIDHLRWKRLSHPEAAEYNMVAELDGKIVGTMMYMVQDVKVGDCVLRSANGIDICVHPDYQGQGIRRAMVNFAWQGVEVKTPFLLMFLSEHPAMNHSTLKLGVERTSLANKVHAFECDVPASVVPAAPGVPIRRVDTFDGRTDAFCAQASAPFQLIVARSRRYLNWRYADPRAGGFAIYVAEEGERLIGYAAARIGADKGYIADVLALPGRLDAVEALLSATLAGFAERSVSTIECWSPMHHAYRPVLDELGFTNMRRTIPVRTRARGRNPDPVTFADDPRAAIHIMAGDSDLV